VLGEAFRLRAIVRDQDERDAELAAKCASAASICSRARSSRAEVGSSRRSACGSSASAREHEALLLVDGGPPRVRSRYFAGSATCSSSRSTSTVRCKKRRRRRLRHRARDGRRQLLDEHRAALQLERIGLANVAALEVDAALLGVSQPVEQPQQRRLARPDGPRCTTPPSGAPR
jgi:hypothetical protein